MNEFPPVRWTSLGPSNAPSVIISNLKRRRPVNALTVPNVSNLLVVYVIFSNSSAFFFIILFVIFCRIPRYTKLVLVDFKRTLCYYLRRRRRLCFYFGLFVCLFVCPSDNWKSCGLILTKFLGGVGHGPGTKGVNLGDDPHYHPDPGVRSPKSGFTGLSKKYLLDSDQSCIAYLICIAKIIQQFYYAGVRRRSVLSEYF